MPAPGYGQLHRTCRPQLPAAMRRVLPPPHLVACGHQGQQEARLFTVRLIRRRIKQKAALHTALHEGRREHARTHASAPGAAHARLCGAAPDRAGPDRQARAAPACHSWARDTCVSARGPHHAAGGDKVKKLDACVRQRQRRRRDGHSQLAAARLKHLNWGAGSAAGQLEHLSYATGRPRQLAAARGRQGALARRCALSSPGRTCFPLPGGTSRPHQAVHVHRGLGEGVQVGCCLQGCLHDRRVLTLLWRLQATEHRELF